MPPPPNTRRRKRAATAKENDPLSKPKTKTEFANHSPVVNIALAAEAMALADEMGMLEKLPILLELFEPTDPKGRASASDEIDGKSILVILGRDIGWVAFSSVSPDAFQGIRRKIFHNVRTGQIETGGAE